MILVTGGTGLVGSHLLVELALRGEQVRALHRATSDRQTVKEIFQHYRPEDGAALFSTIEWQEGDILDIPSLEDAMQGIQKVYHCAAKVSFNPRDRRALLKFNAEGTANVVNTALEENVEALCYVSSTAAVGKARDGGPVREALSWKKEKGTTHYAISKHNAEREVWRGHMEGLPAVIVNPSVVLGPGNWEKSSLTLFKNVASGLPFYTGGSNGFVDARDVAHTMTRLMDDGVRGERFLVAGENLPFRDLFSMIAKEMEKRPPSLKAPSWMTAIGWRAEKIRSFLLGLPPTITRETTRAAHGRVSYSTEKLEATLDLEFTPLSESIRNACAFFRQNGAVNGKTRC